MRKSLLLFIILALTTAIAPAKTLVVNLTASGMDMTASTLYLTSEKTFSVDNVSFAINNFIPKTNCIQGRANEAIGKNFYIYNTTALPNITVESSGKCKINESFCRTQLLERKSLIFS